MGLSHASSRNGHKNVLGEGNAAGARATIWPENILAGNLMLHTNALGELDLLNKPRRTLDPAHDALTTRVVLGLAIFPEIKD